MTHQLGDNHKELFVVHKFVYTYDILVLYHRESIELTKKLLFQKARLVHFAFWYELDRTIISNDSMLGLKDFS